jgi:iron-sulfur cluster repair protein YtfE (RIC family)
MNVTKKCDLCDTALEFEDDGLRLVFKAHDDAFCRGATGLRVKTLERALQQSAQDCGEMKARLSWTLHRHDAETRVLRDAVAHALEGWAGMYGSDQAADRSPDLARVERLLADHHHFEAVVASEMRSMREQANMRSAEALRLLALGPTP